MPVTALRCFACGLEHRFPAIHTLCTACGKPLEVLHDLARAARTLTPQALASRSPDLWRYREVLPVERPEDIVTLGEGFTPLLHARRLGERLDLAHLYVKDESRNPTASFKARGMAVAVSMAKALGIEKVAVPTAGNAGGALAAYAARAGLEATIFMPRDVPSLNRLEAELHGARVVLVDGLITDCAKALAAGKEREGWFDLSTLKEPYRIEGKKTMGWELWEQLGGRLPDVIVYPTGGGTGLVGMWKAFEELERLGWIGKERPRMISVQASGCAPIVLAFEAGASTATEVQGAHTLAAGLRVPRAIGDFVILRAVRASGGCAVAVPDADLLAAAREMASVEGILACPEGGATLAALRVLLERGAVKRDERVVLFNTGSGLKYSEAFAS